MYVGVTGFMSHVEVEAARDAIPRGMHRRLMVGVLASSKTLRGERNKWPMRYPVITSIPRIWPECDPHHECLNLIHYATDDRDTLDQQLIELQARAGWGCDGVQLNCAWPMPAQLGLFLADPERRMRWRTLVLQIGGRALSEAGGIEDASIRLNEYLGLVTDVLIDPSGGHGKALDADEARDQVAYLADRHPRLGIGIAGGLSGDSIAPARITAGAFAEVSVDAEGRLRDEADRLDLGRVRRYLWAAWEALEVR